MKKILAMLLAATMCISLAACGDKSDKGDETTSGGAKESVTLKVWGSQDDQELLEILVDKFKAANPEKEYTIELGVVGEPDAKTKYNEDPSAAADVFAFANDQLYDLVDAGALYEVTKGKDDIIARNDAASVDAATKDGVLYAYPMTSDNGYFMYYDKSVFSEDDVQSFEKMLEVADAAGKKVFMDVSNGWYIASFFLGAGGKLEIEDGKQTCDFNNDTGVLVGEGIKNITASPAFITGDDALLVSGMGDTIAAGISGAWNAEGEGKIMEKLGPNYAATKLPTFKVGDKDVQMSSFSGHKLMGVNSLTKYPEDALALADFLTNSESQLLRFTMRGAGPSNLETANTDEVLANVALSALAKQSQFASSQNNVLGGYWTPAEAFGTAMEAKDYSVSIKDLLDIMVEQITAE